MKTKLLGYLIGGIRDDQWVECFPGEDVRGVYSLHAQWEFHTETHYWIHVEPLENDPDYMGFVKSLCPD